MRILVGSVGVGLLTGEIERWVRSGALLAVLAAGLVTGAALLRPRAIKRERALIVGEYGEVASALRLFESYPSLGVRPVATATPDGLRPSSLDGGSLDDLHELITVRSVSHVICVTASLAGKLERQLGRKRPHGVRISAIQPLGDLLTANARVVDVRGTPFLTLGPRRPLRGPAWRAKRAFDYGFAAAALVALSPVMAAAAVALRFEGGGPVLFRQRRVGRDGRSFVLLKFRSLCPDPPRVPERTDEETEPAYFDVRPDHRLTRVGRVLRRFAIDELPQLLNVLRGDMSMVGPRPFLHEEAEADPEAFEWRSHFLPGVTGPWQVSGRSWMPRREGLRMDLFYVEHWSIRLDLTIVLRTVGVVLRNDRRPSYENTHVVADAATSVSPKPSPSSARARSFTSRRPTKLLVAASAGGHARDLDVLLESAQDLWPVCPSVYVTTGRSHARTVKRPDLEVYVIQEADRRTLLRGVRSAMQSLVIVVRERPTLVVTTGAMPMAILCGWARLTGAKIIWIECISQTEVLSLSARLVRPLTDLMLTQWPGVAATNDRVEYAGEVF